MIRLENVRIQNEKQLSDQERRLQGLKADIETFRTQLRETSDRLLEAERKAARDQKQIDQLTAERDQLKESITQWSSAVAARDAELKHVNENLQKSVSERNQAVEEFNKLAEKYNGTMTELNNRTKEFNALVEKYNALANPGKSKSN